MELILKAKDIRVEFKGRDVLDINELEVYDYDRIGLSLIHILRQQQVQPLRLVLSLIIQISLMQQSLHMQLLRNTVYKYWLRISRRLKRIIPAFGCWGTLLLRFRSIRLIVN